MSCCQSGHQIEQGSFADPLIAPPSGSDWELQWSVKIQYRRRRHGEMETIVGGFLLSVHSSRRSTTALPLARRHTV
jgi:hypothetical protein